MAPRKILNLVLAVCWLVLLLQQPLPAAASAEMEEEDEVNDEELEAEIAVQLAMAEGEGEETTGRSSSTSQSFRRLQAVCTDARVSFREMAQSPDLEEVYREFTVEYKEKDISYFMQDKIVPNHHGSICRNLNVTCCKPTIEKHSQVLANNEYKFYYNQIFESHAETCESPGKQLHRSLMLTMRQLLGELEVQISEGAGWTLPSGTFQPLHRYLTSFASAPDICRLPEVLSAQTQTLVQLTLNGLFEGDALYAEISEDPTALNCILNVSSSLISHHYKTVSSSLLRLLEDLSLFSRSLRLTQDVLSTLRSYTLSDQCVSALTRMSYCPRCGGYGDFKPCLFYCLNTLSGCFADLAEISGDFRALLSSLRVLSRDLVRELSQENFGRIHLTPFVAIAQELQQKKEVLSEAMEEQCAIFMPANSTNSTSSNLNEGANLIAKRSIFQPIQGPKSQSREDALLEQLDLRELETVMEVELGCLERMADKMRQVPDDICFLNKYEVAHKSNSQCWTGSVLGRYSHSKVGPMKVDQLANPEYQDTPLSPGLRYATLISKLRSVSGSINNTVAFNRACQQSDDEDCYRDPFRNCGKDQEQDISESGSSSGSGSGSGSGRIWSNEDDNEMSDTMRKPSPPPLVHTVPTTATDGAAPVRPIFDNYLGDGMNPATQPKPRPTAKPPTAKPFTLATMKIPGIFDNRIPGDDKPLPGVKQQEKTPVSVSPPPSQSDPVSTTAAASSTEEEGEEETTPSPVQDTSTEARGFKTTTEGGGDSGEVAELSTTDAIGVRGSEVDMQAPVRQMGQAVISSSAPLHTGHVLAMAFITLSAAVTLM